MKNIIYIFSIAILILTCRSGVAQQTQLPPAKTPDNVLKLNLSALPLRNFSLQYEHKLGRKFTVALGFRLMPSGSLPFSSQLLKRITDSTARSAISNFRMENWALTPEIRFYTGKKGAPRGFYIALFARYTRFSMQLPTTYTSQNGQIYNLPLSGTLNGIGGGFLLGYQWLIGKHITLDWWILGPLAGISNSRLDAPVDLSGMSAQDQQNLQNNIQSNSNSFIQLKANVSNSGVIVTENGPFAGIRGLGLNLGIAF